MKQKGTEKTGGRVKGTPNKVTKDVRQLLNDIVQSNIANIEDDLKKLTSKERLQIITGLLPYVVPKLQNIEAMIETKSGVSEMTREEILAEIDRIQKIRES
jgi:hypothetical protein